MTSKKEDVDIKSLDPTNPEHFDKLKQYHQYVLHQQELLKEAHQNYLVEKENAEKEAQTRIQTPPPPPPQNTLAPVLEKLSGQIGLQNISDTVRPFSGNPKELTKWFKAIEKHVLMVHGLIQNEECIRVAYKTSKSTVSDFLTRYIKDNASKSWAELKKELQSRFGEKLDQQAKLQILRKFSQKHDQGVQVFAEVILGRGSEIFGDDINHWFIQKELVAIFVKGLRSKPVARKVMIKNPETLAAAVAEANLATERDSRLKAFGLEDNFSQREEEPMDITQVSHQKGKWTNRPWQGSNNSPRDYSRNQWQGDKPICNFCKEVGHMWRSCPKRRNKGKTPLN